MTTFSSIPSSEHVPPLSARRERPLSQDQQARVQKIIDAAERRDWNVLAALAASPGGFIDDDVRRIVCMYEGNLALPLSPPHSTGILTQIQGQSFWVAITCDRAAPVSVGEICPSIGKKARSSWMSTAHSFTIRPVRRIILG